MSRWTTDKEKVSHNNNNRMERRKSRFFTISSPRCELSPTRTLKWPGRDRAQNTCNTSSAYHVKHAVCHLVRGGRSAIKFDRVEIAFILVLSLLAKTINHTKRKNVSTNERTNERKNNRAPQRKLVIDINNWWPSFDIKHAWTLSYQTEGLNITVKVLETL